MTEPLLETDYRRAGFSGQLAWGEKPALVLVDPVLAYLDPECPLYAGQSAQDALEAMVALRAMAHARNIPVVLTGVSFQKGGVDGGLSSGLSTCVNRHRHHEKLRVGLFCYISGLDAPRAQSRLCPDWRILDFGLCAGNDLGRNPDGVCPICGQASLC